MKRLKNLLMFIVMALPFVFCSLFLRLYVGKVTLDGMMGEVFPVIFDAFWIVLLCTLCLVLPKTAGRILYAFLLIVFSVWTFANYIYHCVFKQFLWISDISMASEGTDYFEVVFNYASPLVIVLLILSLVLFIFFVSKCSDFGFKRLKGVVIAICVLGICVTDAVFLQIARAQLNNGAWEVWQRPALIYNEYKDSKKALYTSGLYQYTCKSIDKMLKKDDTDIETQKQFAKDFFKSNTDNEMTGILKGKNVIFVLMESIDDFLICEEYTPEIKRMMDEGINFTNHFSPNMGTGYTFNSEFAANTGFYCPTNASSASVYTKNMYPQTIANRLKNQGYTTSAIHFNSRQFYNREVMYKKWGYDTYHCLMDYMSIEKCVIDSDAIRDDKVYSLITQNKPFMTYFITYSAHLPYNIEDNKLKGIRKYYPDKYNGNEEIDTLRLLAYDTDVFFKLLNQRLEEEGIAEDTVIVAYTDHYAYGINDSELLRNESIKAGSEILEKTPFFIYCKGMESKEVVKVTSTVDIAPTLENLLGLEKMNAYIGNDAFSDDKGLVHFADGRWFDGNFMFNPDLANEKTSYIDDINKYITDAQRVNDFVVEYDYFRE